MTSTGRTQTTGAMKSAGPFALADMMVRVRQGGRLPDLGRFVLVGHPPEAGQGAWMFRTRTNLFANTPAMDRAGLSLDMACWPLRPPAGLQKLVHRDLRVGRSPSSDIVLDHPDVSKLHARFIFDGDQVFIQDASSSTRTLLNGTQVPTDAGTPVRANDTLMFASVSLRVVRVEEVLGMQGAP